MKLSDYKDEEALDLLCDLIDPCAEIFSDSKVKALFASENVAGVAKYVLKEHKKSTIEILARIAGKKVDEYKCTPLSLLKDIMDLFSDKELIDFFTSQAQTEDNESSTNASENTKAN